MNNITYQKQWHFLVKSSELGKLPHALLFFGEKGIGKKDFAVQFANFLTGGVGYPDLIIVEPEERKKEIHISQIRSLIEKLSFKPYLAKIKFAIINNAHLMTHEAQNCFLKFLEEPNEKTFLILITEYPAMLLPTILSRVEKIRFYLPKKTNKEKPSELTTIISSDLANRFQYAKNVSPENLEEILDNWLMYLREVFLESVKKEKNSKPFMGYSLSKIEKIIKQIQTIRYLIFTTNVNRRLALELLLMEL